MYNLSYHYCIQGKQDLDPNLQKDLKSHHYKLGTDDNDFLSQQKETHKE